MFNIDLLNINNLTEVYEEMKSYRARWKFIGIQFGIDIMTLQEIDKANWKVEICLHQLIIHWLKSDSLRPTRSAMKAALKFVSEPGTCLHVGSSKLTLVLLKFF